jgi:hypothetical protein
MSHTFLIRDTTIIGALKEILVEHGYEARNLTSYAPEAVRFSISYNNNPLLDITINRPSELSSKVEMTIVNLGRVDIDNLIVILENLADRFDLLELTFII